MFQDASAELPVLDTYAALAFSGAVHMIGDVVTTLPITIKEGDVVGAAWNAVTGSVLFTWNGVAVLNPDGLTSSPCKRLRSLSVHPPL